MLIASPRMTVTSPTFTETEEASSERLSVPLKFTQPVSGKAGICCHSLSTTPCYLSIFLLTPYHLEGSDFIFCQPWSLGNMLFFFFLSQVLKPIGYGWNICVPSPDSYTEFSNLHCDGI